MSCGKTFLTEEILGLIGTTAERIPVSLWGVEREGLRRFTQALMDPDPLFWDDEYARESKFGEIVTPAIYGTYTSKTPPGTDDPISRAFKENPVSDGIGGVQRGGPGSLPRIPTDLVRILNAGNELEILQYPKLGDRIFSQAKLANVEERAGRDGGHMLIVTNETVFTNHKGDVLCITRSSLIHR